ncbi:MAG: hypothetical protein ACOC3D_05425 [Pseudomonadota bacterium]
MSFHAEDHGTCCRLVHDATPPSVNDPCRPEAANAAIEFASFPRTAFDDVQELMSCFAELQTLAGAAGGLAIAAARTALADEAAAEASRTALGSFETCSVQTRVALEVANGEVAGLQHLLTVAQPASARRSRALAGGLAIAGRVADAVESLSAAAAGLVHRLSATAADGQAAPARFALHREARRLGAESSRVREQLRSLEYRILGV